MWTRRGDDLPVTWKHPIRGGWTWTHGMLAGGGRLAAIMHNSNVSRRLPRICDSTYGMLYHELVVYWLEERFGYLYDFI